MKAIGVDWGTSNLRAFYYDDDELIAETQSSHGIRHLPEGGFEAAFEAAVAPFPSDVPVVLYGMVGANTGWRGVLCRLSLHSRLFCTAADRCLRLGSAAAWLTPGVRHLDRTVWNSCVVMRFKSGESYRSMPRRRTFCCQGLTQRPFRSKINRWSNSKPP